MALGTARGVGALSIQAIATEAGVSKALVLYHFADKPTLLLALQRDLGAASAARLQAVAVAADPLEAWRRLVHEETESGALALLAALNREAEVRDSAVAMHAAREKAATVLAAAVMRSLELRPRIAPTLLGCVLLRQLDGLAVRAGAVATDAESLDAEFDSFALAFLALGH